jgi:hypothetical protein
VIKALDEETEFFHGNTLKFLIHSVLL